MSNERHTKTYSNSNQDEPKWNPKYKQSFCRNIDMEEVNLILNALDSASPLKPVINEATERISIIQDACNKTYPHITCRNTNNKSKPWFGPSCRIARKKNHLVRKQFNNLKTHGNKHLLQQSSKHYKKNNEYIYQTV